MKYVVRFSLNRFASSGQATQDRVANVPNFVEIMPDQERGSISWGRGDLIDDDEHYIAIADRPFTITIRREVLAGQGDSQEWEIEAEEVAKMRKYKKYNCFWNNSSSDMLDFYRALEEAIAAGIVAVDEDDNDGTALMVDRDFIGTFERLAKEHNIDIR